MVGAEAARSLARETGWKADRNPVLEGRDGTLERPGSLPLRAQGQEFARRRWKGLSLPEAYMTMSMMRDEYAHGNKDMAEALLKRLQFPLTLGSFLKALEIGKEYCARLLKERMAKKGPATDPEKVAKCLTEDYAHHGFCISQPEASRIGLNVALMDEPLLGHVWSLYGAWTRKEHLQRKQREEEMKKEIEKLPAELVRRLPVGSGGSSDREGSGESG